jgi:hypothetical protein
VYYVHNVLKYQVPSASRIGPETEASIRTALQKGDMGMRKVAVQFGVATGTVQRIAREVGASVVA